MPANTLSVTRPGRFGNPVRVGDYFKIGDPRGPGGPFRMAWCITNEKHADSSYTFIDSPAKAVGVFRQIAGTKFNECDLAVIRGKDLACYCALGQPCHADVLLEIANQEED